MPCSHFVTPSFVSPMKTPGSNTSSSSQSTSASNQDLSTSRKAQNMMLLPLKSSRMTSTMTSSIEDSLQLQEPTVFPIFVTQIASLRKEILINDSFLRNNKAFFCPNESHSTDFARSLVRQHDHDHDSQVFLRNFMSITPLQLFLSKRSPQ